MKRMIILAALFAMFSAASAFGGDQIRIGYSCCDFEDNFQSRVLDAARTRAAATGVKLIAMDAREKTDLQLQQVDKMIAEGVEALMVVPADTSEVDEIVAAAHKAKVPLVFVNRNPYVGERPPDNCFVIATDATVEGQTQMNYAGPKIGSSGHVVILQGILNNEATQSRTAGVKEVITQSYPELGLTAEATANWRRDTAKILMGEWLKAYGREKIDAVLSNNDEMALGALESLEAAGIRNVLVMGVDAVPEALVAIRDGRMAGTVLQDPVLQGAGGVDIALRAIKGEAQAQNFILPSDLVTQDNVDKFLKQ